MRANFREDYTNKTTIERRKDGIWQPVCDSKPGDVCTTGNVEVRIKYINRDNHVAVLNGAGDTALQKSYTRDFTFDGDTDDVFVATYFY